VSIEAKLRRAGKWKRLVIANGAEAEVNAGLVELIKEAFAIRNQFLSGSHDSIEAMSVAPARQSLDLLHNCYAASSSML
jgi:site-specific DNA recombinase